VLAVATQLLLKATGTQYCLTQLTMAIYYTIVVLGLSLLMGHAGQVSLGHGAFFALGGYTSAILTTRDFSAIHWLAGTPWLQKLHLLAARQDLYGNSVLTFSPTVAAVLALILSGVVAALIGYPALRLRGHYLAMATLGFGLIVGKILVGSAFTGAADGINGVPAWSLPGGLAIAGKSALRVSNFYLACGMLLVVLLLLRNLVNSRIGRALRAIHDGEAAANAMGVDTAAYKLKVFVLSALLAALAGCCFTHYTGGIGPSEASAMKSVRYVALAATGGMSSLWGVTFMSIGLTYSSLRGWFGSFDNAVFGVLLILIISLCPEGPLIPIRAWLARVFHRTAPAPQTISAASEQKTHAGDP
jgi:branched-chain amino acid transport system permease protein